MNEDHRGVGFVHSTDESSNDAGGKGRTISCFCNQNIESTGGIKSMEKEKAEIASLVERYGRVQSLMKYVNSDTLKESYNKQPKGKAVGVDGITKEQYGENLEENIESLLVRMKKFSYKPYPVRRAYIPKGNGKMRGLGIPSFEDKVVQGVFKEILEAIYEPKFKEFSFGFRPNRSCHDAIQRVNKHIMADKVNYILDADIKGFFDNLDHEWMIKFLEHDIADKNFIRYIKRFLIGGVMEDGKRLDTEAGTVQGGLISPVLANVYLHYTLDTWFDYVKKHEFKGEMYMVRYADDFVCLFQYENEAQRFYQLLIERLRKFGLEIAEDKSRILPFGRYKGTKESFDFLGFTHYNATSHWGKYCVLHRTSRKKLKMKREAVKKWLWEHMHESIADTIEALNVKLTGHYRYYGIYGNYIGLQKYYKYGIIRYTMEGDSMVILYILYLVLFVVTAIFGIVCVKIKLAGMNVKDFFDFILAINDLDSLYVYSKSNRKMTKNEQTMFLKEAEKVFSIFEKIPSMIWEDEYEKYDKVLQTYKEIRVSRWTEATV